MAEPIYYFFRSMLTTIFLDNDGVLVDTEKYYYEANVQTSLKYGYDLTEAEYKRLFLANGVGMREVAQRLGWPVEKLADYRTERDRLFREFITTRPIVLPGVAEGLERLFNRHRLCIVTSAPRFFFDTIHQRTGFGRFFSGVVSEETVEQHKPHPAPYLAAMKAMNAGAGDAVAIEDSERGLRSATAAGLRCIVVPRDLTKDQNFSTAAAVAPTFTEAVEIINQLTVNR